LPASESPRRLSHPRTRALSILHPVHALDARLFAHYMWPASPSWRAASPGRGAYLKARSFLARLEAEGLVARDPAGGKPRYRVTRLGERLVERNLPARAERAPAHVRPLPARAS
jgi:hypothetical protein